MLAAKCWVPNDSQFFNLRGKEIAWGDFYALLRVTFVEWLPYSFKKFDIKWLAYKLLWRFLSGLKRDSSEHVLKPVHMEAPKEMCSLKGSTSNRRKTPPMNSWIWFHLIVPCALSWSSGQLSTEALFKTMPSQCNTYLFFLAGFQFIQTRTKDLQSCP